MEKNFHVLLENHFEGYNYYLLNEIQDLMIKQYISFLSILLIQSTCNSQTYSTLIPDQDINEVMVHEIQDMFAVLECDKFTPGKIALDIVDWHQIDELNIDSLHLVENIFPSETEDTLKSMPELFHEKDFKFMALQASQYSVKRWLLPRGSFKLVKKCKRGCARYSIPLFNESRTIAILYKEEIYNPNAACGLIKVYIQAEHGWKEYKSMGIWLM